MSKNRNGEGLPEAEFLEDGYVLDDEQSDAFFDMDEEDGAYEERDRADRTKLLMSALLLFSIIFAVVFAILGFRAFNQAKADAPYADKTWVVAGDFKDLTPDLNTKNNVAVYTGTLPADGDIDGKTYRSDLGDSQTVKAGASIEFRGSQVGTSKGDFPEKVDGLLAITPSDQLQVIRTGDPGSIEQITSSSVTGARVKGGVEFALAAVVLAGGIYGAITLAKRNRRALAAGI